MTLPSIYLITDRHQVPRDQDFFATIEQLLQAGLRMIQLREKDLPPSELLSMAQQLRDLTRRYDSLLLINDRIDIAKAVDADGVHLRQTSMPADTARGLLGREKLIGVSTHTEEEINRAVNQGADFITFGPVYYTPSKATYGFPKGLTELRTACELSSVPVYALGGIKTTNTPATLATGVHGVAVISALLATPTPQQNYRKLFQCFQPTQDNPL